MQIQLTHGQTSRRTAIYGAFVLDFDVERAWLGGTEIDLQQSDWAILARLSSASGTFVRSTDLLAEIWGEDMRDDTAFLGAWIQRLNRRIASCCIGFALISSISDGYRLVSSGEWSASALGAVGQRTTRTVANDASLSPETYIPSAIPARK